MRSFVHVLAATVSLAGVGLAQSLLINTPVSLTECEPAQLTFTGSTPPFFISILPGGQVSATPLESLPEVQAAGSVSWLVDITSGTSVSLQVKDGTGALNFAQAVTIQPGTSTSCLGQNAASSGGSAAAVFTLASSTSGASSGIITSTRAASSSALLISTAASTPVTTGSSAAVISSLASGVASTVASKISTALSASASSASASAKSTASSATTSSASALAVVSLSALVGVLAAVVLALGA